MANIDISLDPDALRAFTSQYRDIAQRWQEVSQLLADAHAVMVQEASAFTSSGAPSPMLVPLIESFTQKIALIDNAAVSFYAAAMQDADTLEALAFAVESTTDEAAAALDNA